MYLPKIWFSSEDFPLKPHVCEAGLTGFDLRGATPATFVPLGFMSECDFDSFMEWCDGWGLKVHHISKRWAVHIPRYDQCYCVVFCYNGRFGNGFALAFRESDGFSSLWYVLFQGGSLT